MPERITKSITVKGDVADIYNLWANFENFPRFMRNVKAVKKTDTTTSHWTVAGPLGRDVEWEAETTRLDENKRIGWNTKDHQGMTTSGEVLFNTLPQGDVEVTVTFQYVPPAGAAGKVVANLFTDPDKDLEEDLRNFKAYAEGMKKRIAR